MEAALIRDKFDVVPSEDHDQMQEEASDSEETPYTSSDTDGEGVGTTVGAQRGVAVGLCVDKEDTHQSSRRSEAEGHHAGRDRWSMTFDAQGTHRSSQRSEEEQHVVRGRQSTTFAGRCGAIIPKV